MEANILDLINEQSCHQQGTPDWFRDRLGCITSSNVSALMTECPEDKEYRKLLASTTLKKGETEESRKIMLAQLKDAADKARPTYLSDGAKTYLRKVAAERNLLKSYINDDMKLAEYLERVAINTRAVRYGSDNEDIARQTLKIYRGIDIAECGFIRHKEIDRYGDSPDGIALRDGKPVRPIEIKFPLPNTWIEYAEFIHDAQSLKEVKPEYYWQCMSHIECCRSLFECNDCDFIFMDKMQKNGFKCINIKADESEISLMKARIIAGNAWIDNLLERIK